MVQGVTAKRDTRRPEEVQPPPPPPPPPPAAPAASPTNDATTGVTGTARPTLQTRQDTASRFNVESGGAQRAFNLQQQFDAGNTAAPTAPAPAAPAGGSTTTKTGDNTYRITAGDNSVNVKVGQGVDPNSVLPKTAEYYAGLPPSVRSNVKEIEFKAEKGDPITTTDDPNDFAGARAGGGKITFYDGANNLNQDLFNHEAAHLAGGKHENDEDGFFENLGEIVTGERGDPVPKAYVDAAKKDGNFTSPYAEDSHSASGYTEDFADGYRGYRAAVRDGTLDQFRSQYPNRTKWFEENYPA